jgi:hypothetical protein
MAANGRKQLALVVAGLALCACGTTVQTAGGAVGAPTAGGNLGGAPTGTGTQSGDLTAGGTPTTAGGSAITGSGGDAAAGGGATTVGSGDSGTGTGTGTTDGSGATTTTAGSSGRVPARAPGITDTKLYVGLAYNPDANAANAAIGAAGAARTYDTRDVVNAMFKYANAHGGFAGRQIEAVWHRMNTTDDVSTQYQAACSTWTEDHKVFAMLGGHDILNACAEKAGAIAVGSGATAATYKRFPHLISPTTVRLDRLAKLTVNGLHAAGYFTGKFGFATWDNNDYRAATDQGLIPALQAKGVPIVDKAYIMVPQQVGALGDSSAAVSSAIARFRSKGIDHVILFDGTAGVWSGGGLTLTWMNQAKTQNYFPRYGGNTNNFPGNTIFPKDQMNHELAVDDLDNDKSKDVGWKTNVTREKCFQIQKDAGYPPNPDNLNDTAGAAAACDLTWFLQRIVNSMSMITVDAFTSKALNIGDLPTALRYGSRLVGGRHDGGGMMRTVEYLQDCDCLQFRTKPSWSD